MEKCSSEKHKLQEANNCKVYTSARPGIANTHDDVPHELDLNVSRLGAVADMDFEAMFSPDSMILVSFPIEESMTNEPEYCWSLDTVTDLLSSWKWDKRIL